MKKLAYLFVFALVWGGAHANTYFTYAQDEITCLPKKATQHCLSKERLRAWDEIAHKAIQEQDLTYFKQVRLYTYLYVAQSEFAQISVWANGRAAGTIDPISDWVLAYFLDDYDRPDDYQEDTFSKAAAKLVIARLDQRLSVEKENLAEFEIPEDLEEVCQVGRHMAKWVAWYLNDPEGFYSPPPPSADNHCWQWEIDQIKRLQYPLPLSQQKKRAVYYWAGLSFPDSGDWRMIANDFIFSHNVSYMNTVQIRAIFMQALYDGDLVCFCSKYRYLVDRPKVKDPSIHYEIKVPKHPSYPSGHSTESTVAAQLLSHFFPAQTECWQGLAHEACMSRLWAGIHYPIDDQVGRQTGRRVAERVLHCACPKRR